MLRFRLFGFPVTVQWFFWIVMALIGGAANARTPESFRVVLIFVLCGFVSILAHELGHAYFQRKYGGRSRIVLHGFGGFAQSEGMFGRKQSLIITAAGPAVSLALGGIFWLIYKNSPTLEMNPYFVVSLLIMMRINLFWGLLNLIPVLPLDGGRLLEHFMWGKNVPLRAKIGFVAALAVVVFAIYHKQIFLAALFGYLAYINYQIGQRKPVVDVFTNSRY